MSRKPVKGEWNYKGNKTSKKVIKNMICLNPLFTKCSVLEPKDAAKSRFLSKTWQRALASFPCIHLDESDFNAKSIQHPNNYPLKNEEIRKKKKAFMTYIDNTLQSRLEHTSSLEVEEFTLKLAYHDKEFVLPRVVKWITLICD